LTFLEIFVEARQAPKDSQNGYVFCSQLHPAVFFAGSPTSVCSIVFLKTMPQTTLQTIFKVELRSSLTLVNEFLLCLQPGF